MTSLSSHSPDSTSRFMIPKSGALPVGRSLVSFFCHLRCQKLPSSARQNRINHSQDDCKRAVLDNGGFRDVLGGLLKEPTRIPHHSVGAWYTDSQGGLCPTGTSPGLLAGCVFLEAWSSQATLVAIFPVPLATCPPQPHSLRHTRPHPQAWHLF